MKIPITLVIVDPTGKNHVLFDESVVHVMKTFLFNFDIQTIYTKNIYETLNSNIKTDVIVLHSDRQYSYQLVNILWDARLKYPGCVLGFCGYIMCKSIFDQLSIVYSNDKSAKPAVVSCLSAKYGIFIPQDVFSRITKDYGENMTFPCEIQLALQLRAHAIDCIVIPHTFSAFSCIIYGTIPIRDVKYNIRHPLFFLPRNTSTPLNSSGYKMTLNVVVLIIALFVAYSLKQ